MKQKKWDQERIQTAAVLLSGLCVTFCLQIMKFEFFPEKYFYDAATVQSMMQKSIVIVPGASYPITAWTFNLLNRIFPVDSQLMGSLTIWVLVILPCGWLAAHCMRVIWSDYILFAVYCVLLPVFVWNTQKEALQLVPLFLIAFCIIKSDFSQYTADILIVSLLLLWGVVFRIYYIIIAVGTMTLMILYHFPWEKRTKRQRMLSFLVLLVGVVMLLFVVKTCFPKLLFEVFGVRTDINLARIGSSDANTIILDLFENKDNSIILYLINYAIAAIRMFFPVELLFKGIQYVPFIILQMFWDVLLLRQIREAIKCRIAGSKRLTQIRFLTVIISWYLVSFLFEPDFGSYIRHQTAMFPVMFPLLTSQETACN